MRVLALVIAVVAALPVLASERVALVIGNANYKTAPLDNPVNDARAMARRLSQLGFKVTKVENATRNQMERAIAAFERQLSPTKTGLFYYAGHGIQVRDRNFMVPVDANLNDESAARFETVNVGSVTEAMEYAKSKVNFIILDACRDNPFSSSMRSAKRGLAPVDAARGTLIAYATAPGDVAADGDGSNGLYTSALLAALDQPGLSAEEVFKQVRATVDTQSGGTQTPWEASSLTGNFIFNAPTTINVQPAPNTAPAVDNVAVEVAYWNSISTSTNPVAFETYLKDYPDGKFANLARFKLTELGASKSQGKAQAALANPKREAPAVDAEAEKRSRIDALLKSAARDVKALRLTSPKASNAVDKYNKVLSLDQGNQKAISGLGDVVAAYIKLAEKSASRGNKASAKRYLNRAESVQESGAIESARERLLASSAQVSKPTAPTQTPRKTFNFPVPEMVSIRAGCFQMGSPPSEAKRDDDERRHRVCVDAFKMGKFEVTFDAYDAFARATGRRRPADEGWGRGRRPVINVSWEDATAYAEWLSQQTGRRYRLPTEAEWEYAARAGTTTPFWTGICINTDEANYGGNSSYGNCGKGQWRARTVPTGTLPANPWGLHEVLGNVGEWTCSSYDESYSGGERRCGSRGARALRGGSWSNWPGLVRSASRLKEFPGTRDFGVGFRLAQD